MLLNEDDALKQKVAQEKKKISADIGAYINYLAYAVDREEESAPPEDRRGIRRFKGTPVWTLLYPARMGYKGLKFVKNNGITGVCHKVEEKLQHAVDDHASARKKQAREYLTKIMPTEEEKQKQREHVFTKKIKISVLVPLYNTPERFLRDMIESVTAQTYADWELCLADASDAPDLQVGAIVAEYMAEDPRIRYEKLKENAGIAENTNACIRMSTGNYLALFDHDDVLHPCALYECAAAIEREHADFVYTDEATFEGEDLENIITWHFKPDYSVDNLRGVNYICHLSVFSKSLLQQVGMFCPEYDGSQDHDLIMRLTDAAEHVAHVQKILYFWRCHQMSTSMNLDAKSYAVDAGRRAVAAAEARRGYPANVYSAQICKTHYRMKYEIPDEPVTIIIDGNGASDEKIAGTAASIEVRSTYDSREVRFIRRQEEMEAELQQAEGTYIIILAAGTTVITPEWIEELLMFTQREDVGMTGMQIVDEHGAIISSDLVNGTTPDRLGIEVNEGEHYDATGYMGRNYYAHNVSAVSGWACMLKKDTLEKLWKKDYTRTLMGRMMEICFALRLDGKQIVLDPYALVEIPKGEQPDRLSASDRTLLMEHYRELIEAGDPYYNRNLSFDRHWKRK